MYNILFSIIVSDYGKRESRWERERERDRDRDRDRDRSSRVEPDERSNSKWEDEDR